MGMIQLDETYIFKGSIKSNFFIFILVSKFRFLQFWLIFRLIMGILFTVFFFDINIFVKCLLKLFYLSLYNPMFWALQNSFLFFLILKIKSEFRLFRLFLGNKVEYQFITEFSL